MTRFKDRRLQEVYELFRQPTPPVGRDGLQTAYQRGLVGMRPPERTSLTYAAWAAGRDTTRDTARSLRSVPSRDTALSSGWV